MNILNDTYGNNKETSRKITKINDNFWKRYSTKDVYEWNQYNINYGLDAWTIRNSDINKLLLGIAYGNNLFVAVGYDGVILTSPDGVTWTSGISNSSTDLTGITYGNGLFVAVGYSGTILTSPDGITWTSRKMSSSSALPNIFFVNNKFVATNGNTEIAISDDGISWSVTALPTAMPAPIGMYYINSKYIMITSGSGIYSSSDCINFSKTYQKIYQASGMASTYATFPGVRAYNNIMILYGMIPYANGILSSANWDNMPGYCYSNDGITWTDVTVFVGPTYTVPVYRSFGGICYFKGQIIFGGWRDAIYNIQHIKSSTLLESVYSTDSTAYPDNGMGADGYWYIKQ